MGKKYIIELEDEPQEYKEQEPKATSDAEEAWQFAAKVFGSDS